MKLTRPTGLLLLCLFLFGAQAQQVTISPIPRTISLGSLKAFDNTATFVINGETTADPDAVALLKSKVRTGTSGVELILGEIGDTNMQEVASLIPSFKEGYYLKVEPGKVIIAGADSVGTFYGVQSFLQLMASPEVMSVTIKDYPSVFERGMIEGFYGNPFTHAARKDMFRFFGENKINVYIYGPKDDPYHGFGTKWRDPYPTEQATLMKELVETAHKNKVNFVWAVHPGNNISWEDNDADGVIDDFKACVNKFQLMYNLSVRAFAVFFDDIGGVGADPANQAKMLNYLNTEFVQKKPDVAPLILCPTQYNKSWSSGTYLSVLGTQVDKSVRIMWTGNSVVDMINKSDMDWINAQISRRAYIWLNYPVTDYCVNHLLMGPTYGNDLNIASQLSGFTANPMEYAEASKVALYSIGDYVWNMTAYNPGVSWLRAIKYLMPQNFDAYKIFCENNVDLGSTYHGLRRENESAPFKAVIDSLMVLYNKSEYNPAQAALVSGQFQTFRDASAELMASTYNPALITEIKPWLQVFDLIGQKGIALIKMYASLNDGDSIAFIREYLTTDSLEALQKTIISRPGTIKATNPTPANEVVAPFIKQFTAKLVLEYRRKYNYREDVFPKILLDEGRYFIKVNGQYLTNQNANRNGGNPVFVARRDTINPQRQEWDITIDPTTERYKIINTQDSRYVNELGNFGTNVFESIWHTYNLLRLNGKYSIQNAGSAGDKYWIKDNNRIKPGTINEVKTANFIFEIIPADQDSVSYSKISATEDYVIKWDDKYLTRGTTKTPVFSVLQTPLPETQQWKLLIDKMTDRYKPVYASDTTKYVSEAGLLGTNSYYSTWNSCAITGML